MRNKYVVSLHILKIVISVLHPLMGHFFQVYRHPLNIFSPCACVHPSLHPNGHHQIEFSIFDLKIYHPLPHLKEVCHYKEANTEFLRGATNSSNWEKAFSNTNINQQVSTKQSLTFSVTIFRMKP